MSVLNQSCTVVCYLCGAKISSFDGYKCHLKVLHSKRSYDDDLVCGHCPRYFKNFRSLKNHIIKNHTTEISVTSSDMLCSELGRTNPDNSNDECMECDSEETLDDLGSADKHDIFEDVAKFVSKLRCLNIPLSTCLAITDMTKQLLTPIAAMLNKQIENFFKDCCPNRHDQEIKELEEIQNFLENPFAGLDTIYKQTQYFKRKGFYIEPKSFIFGQEACAEKCGQSLITKTVAVTGQYISQLEFFQHFLTLPGVFDHMRNYLASTCHEGTVTDFKDGELWRNHPVRLKHANKESTLVIPIFDYFDDVEVANPLGSHAGIHKIGAKYTVIKGVEPSLNSRLENIVLNMLVKAHDRPFFGNECVFDIYLDEMTKLEMEGFPLVINNQTFQIYIVLVQLIGDNLALNGLLGYVESFCANYPCRICKIKRSNFGNVLFEDESSLRTASGHKIDISIADTSSTGVKESCCYDRIPSFSVTNNIFCDIMHDLAEGICRYVMIKVLIYLVREKQFFSLDQLKERMKSFVYDHSSKPPFVTEDNLKNKTLNLGAVEMLNFVLGFSLLVGDLVPENDPVWSTYLVMRQVLLFSCGLQFSFAEITYFSVLISEFLQQYIQSFQCGITLKFHNLIHYPRIIRYLGPLYHMWVMRCEGKHADFKKLAMNIGNFRNICKTLADRHQMKQATRFLLMRGLPNQEILVPCSCECISLNGIKDGQKISDCLGRYGLYREIFTTETVVVNSVKYEVGDIIAHHSDQLFPVFVKINKIFLTDVQACHFFCTEMETVSENLHFQAYEVTESDKLLCIAADQIGSWMSPWPLRLRLQRNIRYVSLRHKF